jgi:tetratricopeptide (TPR) repeat protein
MTHIASFPRRRSALLAIPLAFAATLGVLSLRGAPVERHMTGGALAAPLRPDADTDAQIARLQSAVRGGAVNQSAALAAAYLQKVRETGDASFYARADGVLRRALVRRPNDSYAVVQAATLAAARHDFAGALSLASRARELAPDSLAPFPVQVDALVELGRYGEAERVLQDFVDRKPNLAGYARVSYLRELHGDLDGAVEAMRLAIAAGGPVPENIAYVQTLLGGLELARGRAADARRAYAAALAAVPDYVPALAGRARLAGSSPRAIALWREVVDRLPLPEYAIGLGEAELAAGRESAGRRDLALVGAEEKLLAGAGVNTDVELAVYESTHGSKARGLALARRAWAAAPSVRSADALGWALTRSGRPREGLEWAHRALALGSVDPVFRYHAAVAARELGRRTEAARDLRLAKTHGLAAHPWLAKEAAR